LQNGHYDAVKEGVKRLAKTDPNVSGTAWQVGDQIIRGSSTQEGITRGQVLSNVVGSYVDYLQSILVSKNIDHMTQDQLFEKAMRDAQVRSFLEDTGISNFIVSDFKDFSQKIVELQT
jgi:hypothetical protein